MPPRRANSRGAHVRSISLADENAPVNSLAGPQRSKAALLSKPSRTVVSGAAPSSSKDSTHKSSSSVGGIVPGRRVLGDVSNAVKAAISKVELDAKDNKPIVKPNKVRKIGSQASLEQPDSSSFGRTSIDGAAATYGGNAGKKLVAALKNRSSAQSLNSNGVHPKRKSTSKPSSSTSNPWATAAPKVLREELNEVEVIADSDDHIKLDDLPEVSHDFSQHEYDAPSRDEKMVLDPQEEIVPFEDQDFSTHEDKASTKVEADGFTSASELDVHDEEHMFEDSHVPVQSLYSDENELSLCRNNVDDLSEPSESENWLMISSEEQLDSELVIETIRRDFQDELDYWDATMVAEYSEEIFKYMEELEESTLPNPRYMDAQHEIQWDMRTTLIDWLLQVHMRYHMLPETLWIAVNIIDRFLSKRVVSLVKFQLVGVTAMFVAAKYEEIMAPSVEEFVYMTENGYTRDDILKGEKILLATLEYKISPYCSPYSWLRRISKADDYDIQTRTLSKFLMELTLLDHRFLRAKSSMIAAIGMYTARRMLGADWSDAFIFYSGYTEAQLITPMTFLIEFLSTDGFEDRFVYKKYANRKFLKASIFARAQALKRVREESGTPEA